MNGVCFWLAASWVWFGITGPVQAMRGDPLAQLVQASSLRPCVAELEEMNRLDEQANREAEALDAESQKEVRALLHAVRTRQPELVATLLAANADPNGRDEWGNTLLHNTVGYFALGLPAQAELQFLRVAEQLIQAKADLNAQGPRHVTPLMKALEECNEGVAQTLIEAGACVHTARDDGKTPLMMAAWRGNSEGVRQLIASGARVGDMDDEGNSVLHFAVRKCLRKVRVYPLLEYLIAAGADLGAVNQAGATPLSRALEDSDTQLAAFLLDRGAPATGKNWQGRTPLMMAAQSGHLKMVQRLLEQKADCRALDHKGNSVLHTVADCLVYRDQRPEYEGVFEFLLKAMGGRRHPRQTATPEELPEGMSPEAEELRLGSSQVRELARSFEAEIGRLNQAGASPLVLAASHLGWGAVELLLDYGAPAEPGVEFYGRNTLMLAAQSLQIPLVDRLVAAGANLQHRSVARNTVLHSAVDAPAPAREEQVLAVVHRLVGAKADVLAKNVAGLTPLQLAQGEANCYWRRWPLVADYLLQQACKAQETALPPSS